MLVVPNFCGCRCCSYIAYIKNIVFNIINYPVVKIDIPYHDLGLSHYSNIRISSDVEDNSDIPERLITTQFKRYTIEIVIDDAYLFDVKVKDNLTIVEGHLHTMDTPDIVEDRELIFKNK